MMHVSDSFICIWKETGMRVCNFVLRKWYLIMNGDR